MKQNLTIEQSTELIKRGVSAGKASMVCMNFNGTYAYVSGEEAQTVRDCVNGQFYVEESRVFALADLLSLLPKEIKQGTTVYELLIEGVETNWRVRYYYADLDGYDSTEAFNEEELIDALYKLLLWSIDNNHVKLD